MNVRQQLANCLLPAHKLRQQPCRASVHVAFSLDAINAPEPPSPSPGLCRTPRVHAYAYAHAHAHAMAHTLAMAHAHTR